MRTYQYFPLIYVLVLICQVFLSNYTNLGPYVMLTMLPAMILCIPTSVSTVTCMLIAFASGFATDWLAEGILGLNVAALLPVAVMRKGLIRIFLGEDIIARNDSFSIRKNGIGKVTFALLTASAIFLAIYIFLDGAGTRPFWFCTARFFASLAANMILAMLVTDILTPDDRR